MLMLLKVTSARGSILNLPLTETSQGIVLEEIDGLDPVKATLISSAYANFDGEQYQNSRLSPRNITIKLGLEPDYITETVQDVRKRLYDFFMPKTMVTLTFVDSDESEVYINAHIESFESVLFSSQPEVDISLMCFDPSFIDSVVHVIEGVSGTAETFTYDGTVNAGCLFSMTVNRSVTQFSVNHIYNGVTETMNFSLPLVNTDKIEANTTSGNKYVLSYHTVGAVTSVSSGLYGLDSNSPWISLKPGLNEISVFVTGAPIPWSLIFQDRYGGL